MTLAVFSMACVTTQLCVFKTSPHWDALSRTETTQGAGAAALRRLKQVQGGEWWPGYGTEEG